MLEQDLFRVALGVGILVVLGALERTFPRREWHHSQPRRWTGNIAVTLLDNLLVRALFGTFVPVGVAWMAAHRGWGLFNEFSTPPWVAVAVTLVVLDLVIYWQHRLLHVLPSLWRIHAMHHTDRDLDASSALRFHPLEVLLSTVIKCLMVLALGAPAVAVLAFEVVLNASAQWSHANLRLPVGLDRLLRLVLVTPDMHRVHHSTLEGEQRRNFGFCFSGWDRLFGSYCKAPLLGHEQMNLGISGYARDPESFTAMLATPFNLHRETK